MNYIQCTGTILVCTSLASLFDGVIYIDSDTVTASLCSILVCFISHVHVYRSCMLPTCTGIIQVVVVLCKLCHSLCVFVIFPNSPSQLRRR